MQKYFMNPMTGKTMKNEYANAIVEGVEHYFKDLEVN